MALVTILRQVNNTSNPTLQFKKTVDMLSQKLGEHIEKMMHKEMDKMSTLIISSLAEQSKCHVLIGLHISCSYIGLPLFFLSLPIPEALYDTNLVRV